MLILLLILQSALTFCSVKKLTEIKIFFLGQNGYELKRNWFFSSNQTLYLNTVSHVSRVWWVLDVTSTTIVLIYLGLFWNEEKTMKPLLISSSIDPYIGHKKVAFFSITIAAVMPEFMVCGSFFMRARTTK